MKIKVLREATPREKGHIWRKCFMITDVEEEVHGPKDEEREHLRTATDEVLADIVRAVNARTSEDMRNVPTFDGLLETYHIYSDEEPPLSMLFDCMRYCHKKGIWKIIL